MSALGRQVGGERLERDERDQTHEREEDGMTFGKWFGMSLDTRKEAGKTVRDASGPDDAGSRPVAPQEPEYARRLRRHSRMVAIMLVLALVPGLWLARETNTRAVDEAVPMHVPPHHGSLWGGPTREAELVCSSGRGPALATADA
jgi:hypothetical protein